MLTRLTVTVEVPEIVADLLTKALADSEQVLICPESIHPGYIGKIVWPQNPAQVHVGSPAHPDTMIGRHEGR